MAYFLGKDINVYWTTENQKYAVSGTSLTSGKVASSSAGGTLAAALDSAGCLVRSKSNGMATATLLGDVTGIDFTPGATNEDISYMGKNTNLSAQIKNEFSLTITKKKNDLVWDRLFNNRGRDGVYATDGAGTVLVDATGTAFVHDGLTTTRIRNFGYRLYLSLKGTTEIFVVRNCCLSAHTISLNADGTQEETAEFYSYVKPRIVSGTALTSVTSTTTLADL